MLDQSAWKDILAAVQVRLGNSRDFNTWFRCLKLVGTDGDALKLLGPDQCFVDYWLDETNYPELLTETIENQTGRRWEIRLRSTEENGGESAGGAEGVQGTLPLGQPTPSQSPTSAAQPAEASAPKSIDETRNAHLLPDYVFETFVKGESNELAYAASKAVADNPGTTYNPLFIYGGVGLGKTHLLHAIGNEIARRRPGLSVRYVTSEDYMNDYIDAIQGEKLTISEFRARYRNDCDVLLVDDIQFVAGKEGTQQEFFHTFNALHAAKKQIVFSSDRFPEEIPKLEERLRSRFQWGLIADVRPPKVETRVAILERKARARGLSLPNDVAMYIASRVRSNVRQLEGALMRLTACAELHGANISLATAKEVLKDFLGDADRPTNPDDIIKRVADHYGVKASELRGSRRHKAVSLPRQVAMYLCRQHTSLSFPEIGTRFGGRDHSTVMSAVRKIEKLLEEQEDADLRKAVDILERQIES